MVTPEIVARVLATFKTAADSQFFFDNLTSPEWVEPLMEGGLFDDPAGPVVRGDSTFFPPWGPSRYLARVAEKAPDAVHRAIERIPDNGNPQIYADLVDAALKLPAPMAADLAARAISWAQNQYHLLLPEKLADLSVMLVLNSFPDEGLALLKELLTILPDPRGGDHDTDQAPNFLPNPRPRIDEWDYKQILEDQVPKILNETGIEGLRLVLDLLESYVLLSESSPDQSEPGDTSFIWRPAIEDHTQNRSGDLDNALVEAVRNGAQRMIESSPEYASAVIHELESKNLYVFQRIALHLLRTNPETLKDEIPKRLMSSRLINAVESFHEFWLLAGEQLWNLDEATREHFLTMIDSSDAKEDKDDDREFRRWKWRRIALLGSGLPQPWGAQFEELKEEFGNGEHQDFLVYSSGVMTGPNSPLGRDDLLTLSPEQIVDWVREWNPTGGFMEPSHEGLGRELSRVVTEKAAEFANAAGRFVDVHPPYVRALIDGLKSASDNETIFDWGPVLELCNWVVSQQRGVAEDEVEQETNWIPTRRSIAGLLSAGFTSANSGINYGLRPNSWSVLVGLMDDPEPARERELSEDSFFGDPATASINQIRGMGMHAVVRYALWVKRNVPDEQWNGFADVPEAGSMFEKHLDPTQEPTATVRAVYGQWLPWLIHLDSEWTESRLDLIFPPGPESEYLMNAAWGTYLKFSNAYDSAFDMLRNRYSWAVSTIDSVPSEDRRHIPNEATRLAEHIMIFYWRKKIDFGQTDSLLERFFETASPEIRSDAIGFIGRIVGNYEGDIPVETMERLVMLWEYRISLIKQSDDVQEHRKELEAFGWWFRSSAFDVDWGVDKLLEVLQITQSVECDTHVVERLAEINSTHPYESVRAFKLMSDGDKEGWHMSGWREHARTILNGAIQSDHDDAATVAKDLINLMAAKYDRRFVDLLE